METHQGADKNEERLLIGFSFIPRVLTFPFVLRADRADLGSCTGPGPPTLHTIEATRGPQCPTGFEKKDCHHRVRNKDGQAAALSNLAVSGSRPGEQTHSAKT